MVKEFDWINAYDWETSSDLNGRKLSELVRYEKIFEGSLKSAQSNLPKKVSFYTWWRLLEGTPARQRRAYRQANHTNSPKILMYVLSFTDGDLRGEKGSKELDNFVKLAPNLRNIVYESPNPYIAGTEYDEIGFPWAPSLSKAFQRISRKRTVTSLNYPFGFYNEERVNNKIINNKRTFVISSVDYDLFTDEDFESDLPQDFVFEYRVDDIGDITDMQEIADKIVEDISDETGLLVLGFYFQEKMSDGTLVSLDAESFWGNSGSGVLVVARDTQRILLGLRSWDVMEPNTWGNFGGAIGISDDGEPEEALPPEDNALKEMAEEINYTGPIEMIPSFTYRNNSFTYYNYIGMVDSESQIALNQFNWEISELRWFTLDEVLLLPNLHFGISELMRQEKMVTFNAPGIADEEYRTFFNKDFELTSEPQFVLFEELPVITQDDIVYMAIHPTWGNPILAEEYAYCHPNYFKRDLQGIEFPTFNANMNDINFPLVQRNRHTPTILKYLEQLKTSNAPPILISGNEFIDGGHRFLAYELAGRRTIPVVDIGNLLTIDLREYLDTGEGDTTALIHQFSAEDNAQNITYDEFGQPYVTLYHAGTMDNHELISITGLRTNLPGWDPKTEFETYDNEEGIYFTTNLDKAIKWIGWKYRQEFCDYDGGEQLDETELVPFPNEVAGVVYAVQFPLIKRREILKSKKWNRVKEQYDTQSSYSTLQLFPEDLSKDEIVEDAWVSKQSIPIDELEVVGFYSLPICFSQGWNDWGFGITEITKSEAMDIHNRGFTMERVEWSPNSGDYEPISDSKYKPRYHLTLPRDSMYSSYKGWFAAELRENDNVEDMIDLGIPNNDWPYQPDMQSVKYDDFGNPFVTFYHATTMDNYESIEAFGLRMSKPGYYEKADLETWHNRAGIYFATNFESAQNWIGWKYRDYLCREIRQLDVKGYEVSLNPNEIAGVVYAVDFPLDPEYDDFNLFSDALEMGCCGNWYSTNAIPRSEMSLVGFYSLPICQNYGRSSAIFADTVFEAKQITESTALQIHNQGFYIDAKPVDEPNRYLPIQHIKMPRDPIFSGYRGTFMAESVPMADWNKLSPVELVDLISFPSDDGHGDAWVMYIPRDWPHHVVLDKAEDEITQRLRALPQGFHPKERRKIFDETYSKYFDFWYIPGTEYSMTGGGYQELTQSIQDDYEPDYFKEEAEKRGIPFDTNLSLEEARKYLPKSTVDWAEKNNRLPRIYAQAIVKAMIQDYLDLGRDKIFYTPLLAAAPMDAEVGTDASKESNLIAGWHRDAYANILYQQDPSQGGAPTVFFKPKEEYL